MKVNSYSLRPCFMVVYYRMAHFCSICRKKNILNNIWCVPFLIIYRLVTEIFFGYEIQAGAKIGKRFIIHHGYSVVINKFSIIGDDFVLRHNVTIGNSRSYDDCPIIGNNVELGAGVMIIGSVIIGDNVKIGAGSIVVSDVKNDSIVVGYKARIIK